MTKKQRKEIKAILENIKDLVCIYVLDNNIDAITENNIKKWINSLYNEVSALQKYGFRRTIILACII